MTPLHLLICLLLTCTILTTHGTPQLNNEKRLEKRFRPMYHITRMYSRKSLLQAILEDNVNLVNYCLDHGESINTPNQYGTTPLHLAASRGNGSIVRCLLRRGANAHVLDNDGRTPIDLAIRKGHVRIAEMISFYSFRAPQGWKPLQYAAAHGPLALVRHLVARGESVTAIDERGKSPLEYAYENVQISAVDLLEARLRDAGIELTPMPVERLHDIAMDVLNGDDQMKIERLLVDAPRYHIVLNHDRVERNTLLVDCLVDNNVLCVERLLLAASNNHQIALDPNAPYLSSDDSVRIHPLDYAMNHARNAELTKLLLEKTGQLSRYLNANAQNEVTGRNALMNAITANDLEMVQLFVGTATIEKLYVDITLKDMNGKDIFQLAEPHSEIAQYLNDHRTHLNVLEGFRPFECCACLATKPNDQAAQLPCGHKSHLCRSCEGQVKVDRDGFRSCPMCRQRYI